jgi:hypothetical protein
MIRQKFSVRTLVITSETSALVITQDARRRRRPITGSYVLRFAPGKERTLARHLGCTLIARMKPSHEPYQALVGGSI